MARGLAVNRERSKGDVRDIDTRVRLAAADRDRWSRVIVCGHTRWLAAQKLGLRQVPVHTASNLTPAQIKAYRLMDNRSHQETDWDVDLLTTELLELRGLDLDLDLTGFDAREIDSLLFGAEDDERADVAPALPEHPVTLPGDLWICGPHRVLRGDATSAEDVACLLGDAKPFLMVTDLPRRGLTNKPSRPPALAAASSPGP